MFSFERSFILLDYVSVNTVVFSCESSFIVLDVDFYCLFFKINFIVRNLAINNKPTH